jgi:hypothetical protein
MTGWSLDLANGVSADGNTIVGFGRDPGGNNEAWIATLPAPGPIPGAGLLSYLALAILGLGSIRWKRLRKGPDVAPMTLT